MTKPVIELDGVDFGYGEELVLEGISFVVEPGAFVTIVGPNGGGKSTLLRLLLGLESPRRGQVRVLGAAPSAVRRRVGFLPQQTQLDPDFPITVREVVAMGRLGAGARFGFYRRADRAAAERALDEVGCLPLAGRQFAELSGGQRQRVLTARALVSEPELLLLDEPTASLDPGVQDELYELLHELNHRVTIVLVSHDMAFVSKHVSQVLCVHKNAVLHAAAEIDDRLVATLFSADNLRLVRHDHEHGSDCVCEKGAGA